MYLIARVPVLVYQGLANGHLGLCLYVCSSPSLSVLSPFERRVWSDKGITMHSDEITVPTLNDNQMRQQIPSLSDSVCTCIAAVHVYMYVTS